MAISTLDMGLLRPDAASGRSNDSERLFVAFDDGQIAHFVLFLFVRQKLTAVINTKTFQKKGAVLIAKLKLSLSHGLMITKMSQCVETGSLQDLLQVLAKLNCLPCLWLFRGFIVTVSFETDQLTLTTPAKWGENKRDITTSIPLTELCQLSAAEFQKKHLWPMVAKVAAQAFKMPKTARAISRGAKQKTIEGWMNMEFKHKVVEDDLWNLLFAAEWVGVSKYSQPIPAAQTIWNQVTLEN